MAAMRATARTSPFCRACARMRGNGFGLEKATWPIARAERAVGVLWLIGMTCTVEVAVRWGSEVGVSLGEEVVGRLCESMDGVGAVTGDAGVEPRKVE